MKVAFKWFTYAKLLPRNLENASSNHDLYYLLTESTDCNVHDPWWTYINQKECGRQMESHGDYSAHLRVVQNLDTSSCICFNLK